MHALRTAILSDITALFDPDSADHGFERQQTHETWASKTCYLAVLQNETNQPVLIMCIWNHRNADIRRLMRQRITARWRPVGVVVYYQGLFTAQRSSCGQFGRKICDVTADVAVKPADCVPPADTVVMWVVSTGCDLRKRHYRNLRPSPPCARPKMSWKAKIVIQCVRCSLLSSKHRLYFILYGLNKNVKKRRAIYNYSCKAILLVSLPLFQIFGWISTSNWSNRLEWFYLLIY